MSLSLLKQKDVEEGEETDDTYSSTGSVDPLSEFAYEVMPEGRTNSLSSATSLDSHNPEEEAISKEQRKLQNQRIKIWSGVKKPKSSQHLNSLKPYEKLSVIDPSTLRSIEFLDGDPITPITPNTNRVIRQIMTRFPKSKPYLLSSLSNTCRDIGNNTKILKDYLISSIYWVLEATNIGVDRISRPRNIVNQVLLGYNEFDDVVAKQIKECKRSQIASTSISIEEVIKSLKNAISKAIRKSMNQDRMDIQETIIGIGTTAIQQIDDEHIPIQDRIEIGRNAFKQISNLAEQVSHETIGGKTHRHKRSKRKTRKTRRTRKTKRKTKRRRTRRRKV